MEHFAKVAFDPGCMVSHLLLFTPVVLTHSFVAWDKSFGVAMVDLRTLVMRMANLGLPKVTGLNLNWIVYRCIWGTGFFNNYIANYIHGKIHQILRSIRAGWQISVNAWGCLLSFFWVPSRSVFPFNAHAWLHADLLWTYTVIYQCVVFCFPKWGLYMDGIADGLRI